MWLYEWFLPLFVPKLVAINVNRVTWDVIVWIDMQILILFYQIYITNNSIHVVKFLFGIFIFIYIMPWQFSQVISGWDINQKFSILSYCCQN